MLFRFKFLYISKLKIFIELIYPSKFVLERTNLKLKIFIRKPKNPKIKILKLLNLKNNKTIVIKIM